MTTLGPYELNTIVTGDCLDCLRRLPNECIDLIFTSPPYNLGVSSGGGIPYGEKIGKWGKQKLKSGQGSKLGTCALADGYDQHADDMPYPAYQAWQKEVLLECWRVIKPTGAIFYNHKTRVQNGLLQTPLDLNPGLPVRQIIIWKRAGGVNFATTHYVPTHEWIVILAKPDFRLKSKGASGVGDVWEVPQESDNPHPAPFPVGLPLRAIETVAPKIVLDPFIGSGTTAVAAKMSGCDYLGFDIGDGYIIKARQRLADTIPLFITTEKPMQASLWAA